MLCFVTTDDYYGNIVKLMYNLFTRRMKSVIHYSSLLNEIFHHSFSTSASPLESVMCAFIQTS